MIHSDILLAGSSIQPVMAAYQAARLFPSTTAAAEENDHHHHQQRHNYPSH
jgi:hypothetical protein